MFLVGFTGYSGGGKTTLAERVVRELSHRGYSVSCIKDAHHRIDLDTPGKDTHRYRTAGASQVVLRTPERWALMEETGGFRKPLSEILQAMKEVDIAVLEGFKHEGDFPKIEVVYAPDEREPLWKTDSCIAAVASPKRDERQPECVAWLDIQNEAQIADFIIQLKEQNKTSGN